MEKEEKKIIDISNAEDQRKLFGEKKEKSDLSFSKVICIFSDAVLVYCLVLMSVAIKSYFDVIDRAGELGILPDLSFFGYIIPAAFVFAGLTHTFYYNKERFANCIKLRFEYIKQLLMFKLNSGMYSTAEMQMFVDNAVGQAEMEADALISNDLSNTEMIQDNINV